MSSAEGTRRDFLYIATGAVAAVGAAGALWPLIAQMNPDASTIAAGAPIEVDLAPIAEGQVIKVFWRGKPIYINHRTKKQIEEAKNVDVAKLPDPQPEFGARQGGSRAVAGPDRHLHPSRLHPDRPSGPLRRLLLPLPRLGLRHLRPHPQRPRAHQPGAASLRVPLRHQDPDRLTAADLNLSQGSIMSGHQTYQPQSAFMRWMERRLPIAGLVYSSFIVYPVPRNLNYWWTFGGILAFMLGVQIVTGIVLAMHYTPHVDFAFNSVEQIMRDVNYGWLLRYLHANGASMFFLAAYIHMFRGMYYGSYKEPREVLWILGVILLLLMIMTGFMGYVLPWGQMSFWAATVITNLFSAIPLVGESIVSWLWGGYRGRQSDAQSLLLAALPAAVRHRRRGGAAHLGAAHGRAEQSDRHRAEDRDRHGRVHALCDHQGQLLPAGVLRPVRLVRVLYSELPRPSRQLHPGQSGGDADAHRAGMVLPAVLRDPARDPEQAPGRRGARRLDPDPRSSCRGSTPRRCARRATVRSTGSSSGCS